MGEKANQMLELEAVKRRDRHFRQPLQRNCTYESPRPAIPVIRHESSVARMRSEDRVPW